MSEPRLTTEQTTALVSLDDLKRAIEFLPPHPGPCIPGQNVGPWLASIHEHRRWAVEAWRTAFEWRDRFGNAPARNCVCKRCREECAEYDEAMRLIREKLQS